MLPEEERNFAPIDPDAIATLYVIKSCGDPDDQLHISSRAFRLKPVYYEYFSLGGLGYDKTVPVLVDGIETRVRAVLVDALRARASRVAGHYVFWADGLDKKLEPGLWPRYRLVRDILTYANHS